MTKESKNIIIEELSKNICEAERIYNISEISSEINITVFDDNNLTAIYDAAKFIIEPEFPESQNKILDEYYEFQENNMDQWANFISESFGTDWGKIAQFVNEYGY